MVYSVFFARRRFGKNDYRTKLNLIPFKEKYSVIQQLNVKTISTQKDFFIDLFGNIFMFIPFCYAIIWLMNKEFSNQKLIILIISSSVSIEILQFIFNKGVPDLDDVILNTVGGCVGIALQKFTNRIKAL
jgi:glycopeptide antibiotics resistance protein